MTTPVRAAAHLVVLGSALVVAAVQGGSHPAAAAAPPATAVVAAAYQPPAFVPRPHTARVLPTRQHSAVPRPVARTRAATPAATDRATAQRHHHTSATTSFRTALMAAVARIPTYRSGSARWVVSRAYAFWGTADWYHDVLYVSPDVPRDKLYDVAVHEWSHELSVLDYDGDVAAATNAMNAWFGGSGLTGPERAADCMSILQGARWTHYTTCTDAHWRAGAALLVKGQQL